MTNDKIIQFQSGFNTAFINSNTNSNLAYRPQFIYNNNKDGQKVFSAIEDELCKCDSFTISVAFITRGGITPLLQTLKELERRGIPGRILTTDYLTFSDPVALDTLAGLSNVELRMYQTERAGNGFHTKGYIFQNKEEYRFIIGSSNLTQDALTRNMEWNTKLVSTDKGEMLVSILDEFDKLWNSVEFTKTYDEFIQDYRRKYKEKQLFDKMVAEQKKIAKNQEIPSIESYTLQPNSMQRAFIYNLLELRNKSVDKALLISATGTGKTYASAFAMRELGFRRVLFLVHRNQIAKQAKTSFETVFGNNIRTGLVSGTDHDYNADFVFATVQTLSRQEHLDKFSRNYFDACIYDEAHHTSAGSYKKVMDYFTPKFTLGMTATPDKRDDNIEGRNIYEVFDYNIAYEIRLQQAMDEDLLCPFHYFGITDLAMVSDQGKSKEEQLEHFRYLTSDERVKYVMKQSEYYGYSGDRVKGLIFCSRIEEARELSVKFNECGWKTIALSGADPEKTRLEAIDRLTMDVQSGNEDYLDYIITVDIFSEGTDIVEVNQVIMLRPTQSPIVFIQQLGRGLRKAPQKEYVVILDFIGNYKNNFMIPIALSGDRSYNKDNIRRYLLEGGRVIPGASTIHFDEISRKRIFAAVDGANFSDIKLIKENYTNLKNKLGRIPKLKDFDDYGEMDVLRIFDNNSLGSYYKFLEKYEKDYTERLSPEEEKVIEFVSKKLANGKRIQELKLLDRMLGYAHEFSLFSGLQKELHKNYGLQISQEQKDNIVNIMTNQFPAGASKKTYSDCIFLEKDDQKGTDYHVSKSFEVMLANKEFYGILKELIDFGISRYERDFSHTYRETDFVLYQKYTYEDVCRLLNWETNEVPLNIGGYKFDKKTKTFPVFINYDKSEDISDTTKYEDHFISSNRLIAISKSGRSIQSEDVQNFLHAEERGIQVHLFVRKNKDDKISKEFYYLGYMHASGNVKEFVMSNTSKTAVEIEWLLDVPVREDLYEYIINE
ncbi:DEAD/DEAH box helicase [Jutongia sp.]|uniref:DEAD/DEAH box helicase n=1 Tax=Jutongia sp. TaxID=2944204 RepID=UPI00307AA1F1